MHDKVKYENKTLEIHYDDYGNDGRNYGELFDFLGDYDVITASEIGQDVIVMNEIVFQFSHMDEGRLQKDKYVYLSEVSSLKDFIDFEDVQHVNFYKWYYSL